MLLSTVEEVQTNVGKANYHLAGGFERWQGALSRNFWYARIVDSSFLKFPFQLPACRRVIYVDTDSFHGDPLFFLARFNSRVFSDLVYCPLGERQRLKILFYDFHGPFSEITKIGAQDLPKFASQLFILFLDP